MREKEGLTKLGSNGTVYSQDYDPSVLETRECALAVSGISRARFQKRDLFSDLFHVKSSLSSDQGLIIEGHVLRARSVEV